MTIRPLTFATLAIIIHVFIGRDLRIIRDASSANKLGLLFILMLGFAILILAFSVGVGYNSMVINRSIIVRNLWEIGLIVVLGDFIRYKLIKQTTEKERRITVFILTIVLVYSQMGEIHRLTHGNMGVLDAFFELIFSSLVIGSVVSYFAIKGSFLLVALVSFVYTMTPYLIPILPTVSLVAFSIIISILAFISAIIYYFLFDKNNKPSEKIAEKRVARYNKKTLVQRGMTIALICLIIAFVRGMFPIYPTVILTESMTGTFNRGSLVFIERIKPDEVFNRIQTGDVIHFISHTGIEYVHRVVDITYDAHGERQYITRGDAVYLNDPSPVPQSEVLGIVHTFLPYIGYPMVLLSERR